MMSSIFDGGSMVVDATMANLVAAGQGNLSKDLVIVDLDNLPALPDPITESDMRPEAEAAYRAIVLGTRDYHAQMRIQVRP